MRIVHQISRDCERTYTITDADGNNVTIGAGDVVRVKIGRSGEAPILDLSSKANTVNGSSVSAANPSAVVIRAADLNRTSFHPGVYDLEVAVVDDSDDDKIKFAGHHVFVLTDTQQGSVGV